MSTTLTRRKVIALARVSTHRQNKLSPKVQLDRIQSYADAYGMEVIAKLSDAESGRKASRIGLNEAIRLAIEHKAVIVTYDMSRLFRDARHMLNTFDLLEKEGAAYASVADQLSTMDGSATAKLFRTILGAICQFQSDLSGQKVAESNRATVLSKRCPRWPQGHRTNGKQPAGWMLDENGYRVPCQEELDTLEKVRSTYESLRYKKRLRIEGGGFRKTADILNAEGVPTISELRARRNNRENRHSKEWTWLNVRTIIQGRGKKHRKKVAAANSTPSP
jgi:predicted site-specific integrase-resolvase